MFRRRKKQTAAVAAVLIGGMLCSNLSLAAAQSSLAWQTNLEAAKQLAAQTNRLVLVHFWSPSCGPCKQVEKNVFSLPAVQQAVEARFVPVKINADDWPTTTKQYGINALPTDMIITPSGQIVGRMISPQAPDAYLQQLAVAASGAAPGVAASNAAQPAMNPSVGAAAVAASAPSGWMPAAQPAPTIPTASAMAPSPTSPVAPNAGWGAATSTAAKPPAVPAYSDSRYSEYFQRFTAASTGASAGVPVGAGAAPAAAVPASPAASYSPPAYAAAAYAPPAGGASNGQASVPSYSAPAVYSPQSPYGAPANTASGYGAPASASPMYPPQSNTAIAASATTTAAMSPPIGTARYSTPPMQSQPVNLANVAAATTGNASPPLALDGYCPVSLAEQQRWQMGDRRWGAIHRGRTYLFSGPEQQRKFLANPDRYSPAISGEDVVMALDHGQEVEGKRALGVEFQNRIYLFSSDASRQAFSQNPKRYAAEVLQAETPQQTVLR